MFYNLYLLCKYDSLNANIETSSVITSLPQKQAKGEKDLNTLKLIKQIQDKNWLGVWQ
jgi:hypothetical protein